MGFIKGMKYVFDNEKSKVNVLIEYDSEVWEYSDEQIKNLFSNLRDDIGWKRDALLIDRYIRMFYNTKRVRSFAWMCEYSGDEIYLNILSALDDAENNHYISENNKSFCKYQLEEINRFIWKIKNPRNVPKELRDIVIRRDGNKCAYCGKELAENEINIDHIKPYSKGGETKIVNLTVSCKSCNSKKRDKSLEEFLHETHLDNC